MAMVALGEKQKNDKPHGSRYSLECWFQRAITWRPDDSILRMIYTSHLNKTMRIKEAEQQLNVAASQAGDNALTHPRLLRHDLNGADHTFSNATARGIAEGLTLKLGLHPLHQRT